MTEQNFPKYRQHLNLPRPRGGKIMRRLLNASELRLPLDDTSTPETS